MSEVRHATDATFASEVLESTKPVLVDFWAPWCGPCKQIAPVLEEIARDYKDQIAIVKVDIDENPWLAREYAIMSIPTLVLVDTGRIVKQMLGAKPKAAILRELGLS